MTTSIRVLIADDHPIVRDGLAAVLATQPDLEVVGQASTGLEAFGQIDMLAPDVVLMDLQVPAWSVRSQASRSLLRNAGLADRGHVARGSVTEKREPPPGASVCSIRP
jgi:DNA-binding NarL/FixJ family response regulator